MRNYPLLVEAIHTDWQAHWLRNALIFSRLGRYLRRLSMEDDTVSLYHFTSIYLRSPSYVHWIFQSFIKDTAIQKDFQIAISVFSIIKDLGLFNQNHFNRVAKHAHLVNMRYMLDHMQEAGVLKRQHLKTIIEHKHLHRIIYAINKLYANHALTQKSLRALLKSARPTQAPMEQKKPIHILGIEPSASESANRLFKRYAWLLDHLNLQTMLGAITDWANELALHNPVYAPVKECIQRIIAGNNGYTDKMSAVNVHQLLALCWIAIHHQELREGSLAHAQKQFCEALYEIQKAYERSLPTPNPSACAADIFNYFIKKLEGIHSDIEALHGHSKVSLLKLYRVVKEEALRYLVEKTNPVTELDFINITAELKQIEKNGVSAIWNAIKNNVAHRLFNELSFLFTDQKDQRFIDLMHMGLSVELGQLPSFQKTLSESAGYKEHCRAALKSHGLFSQKNRTTSKVFTETKTPSAIAEI